MISILSFFKAIEEEELKDPNSVYLKRGSRKLPVVVTQYIQQIPILKGDNDVYSLSPYQLALYF